MVDTTDRAAVGELITMTEYVDVIVPRGGKGLIARLMEEARVPMIKHLDGICHVYVDDRADIGKGARHLRQREDASLRHLQHDGNAAGRARHRAGGAAALARAFQAKEVELRVDAAARAVLERRRSTRPRRRHRGRLAHRIPRADPGDQGGRRTRRGDRAHQRPTARTTPMRSSPKTTTARCASCAKSIRRP